VVLIRVVLSVGALWLSASNTDAQAAACDVPQTCVSQSVINLREQCQGEPRLRYTLSANQIKGCPRSFTYSYSDYEGRDSKQIDASQTVFSTCGRARNVTMRYECAAIEKRKEKSKTEANPRGPQTIGGPFAAFAGARLELTYTVSGGLRATSDGGTPRYTRYRPITIDNDKIIIGPDTNETTRQIYRIGRNGPENVSVSANAITISGTDHR